MGAELGQYLAMIPPNATGKPPRVLFLADAGAQIGGGHAMRCLTLADALVRQGASCAFVAHPGVAAVLRRFASGGIEVLPAEGEAASALTVAGVGHANAWRADVVVVDSYRLGQTDHFGLRGDGRRIVVIDDLADRTLDCDVVIDPTFARSPSAYDELAPAACERLLGPQYALLRPEFAARRAVTLGGRETVGPPGRVLVALGLTDVGGVTGEVMSALAPICSGLAIDVVVGSTAPSLERLRDVAARNPSIVLHVETQAMANLTAAADIGVGAGGSSVWERACLGLPSINVVLAENQGPMSEALDEAGVLIAIDRRRPDFAAALAASFGGLLADSALRLRLSTASSAICDGAGAAKAAAVMMRVARARPLTKEP